MRIILLLTNFITLSYPFVFNGFQITDLTSTTAINFEEEISHWSIASQVPSQLYSKCGPNFLLGGPGILQGYGTYSETLYTGLPPHDIIYYSVFFVLQDNWSGTDYIALQFDSKTVLVKDFISGYTMLDANYCPGSATPYSSNLRLHGRLHHTSNQLRFRVVNYVNGLSSDKSFGFREIYLTFANTASSLSEMMCLRSSSPLLVPKCPCEIGKFQNSAGQCQNCPSVCERCFGPLDSECFYCDPGNSFDGTVCKPCHSWCKVCHGSTSTTCDACASNKFLIGYSCIATCTPPLVYKNSVSPATCTYPCQPNEYLFPDSSCSATCPSPLTGLMKYTIKKFCQSSCGANYIYSDGSCNSLCSSPFTPVTSRGIKMCELPICGPRACIYCNSNANCPQYYRCDLSLNGKGLCMPYIIYNLNAELVQTIKNGYVIRVEVIPILDLDEGPNDMLTVEIRNSQLTKNTTTSIRKISKGIFIVTIQIAESIESALLSQYTYSPGVMSLKSGLTLPQIAYISPELEEAAEAVATASVVGFVIMAINTVGFVMSGGLATIWSFLPENQYTYYLIYLNVDYIYHTKVYLRSLANYDMLVDLTIDDNEKETEIDSSFLRILPERFVDENYSPSFQENAGQILTTLLCIAVAILIVAILFKFLSLPRRSYLAHRVLKTIRRIIRWNGLIRQLLTYSLPMSLASFVQIHVSIFDRDISVFPPCLAILTLIILMIGFLVMSSLLKNIPSTSFERIVYSEWYGTLWEDLNLDSKKTRYYYWIISVRGIVLSYVAVFFELMPLVQIGVLMVYQIYVLSLFFRRFKYQKVFNTNSLNIVTLIQEALVLVIKGMILICYIIRMKTVDTETLITIGWLVIIPGLTSQAVQCLYSTFIQICQVIELLKRVIEKIKKLFNRKKAFSKIRRVKVFR